MVIASHVILSAYGFWLPNDPRGSWSDFVRQWELLRFGPATKVETRNSVAGRSHDVAARCEAKHALRYPPVAFSGKQALCVAKGFADGVRRSGFVIHACCILPDHAHLVIARHHYPVEQVANRLKGAATRILADEGLHPMAGQPLVGTRRPHLPSPWAEGLWKVFIDDEVHLQAAIAYVERNPLKEGKAAQNWKQFVTPHVRRDNDEESDSDD